MEHFSGIGRNYDGEMVPRVISPSFVRHKWNQAKTKISTFCPYILLICTKIQGDFETLFSSLIGFLQGNHKRPFLCRILRWITQELSLPKKFWIHIKKYYCGRAGRLIDFLDKIMFGRAYGDAHMPKRLPRHRVPLAPETDNSSIAWVTRGVLDMIISSLYNRGPWWLGITARMKRQNEFNDSEQNIFIVIDAHLCDF